MSTTVTYTDLLDTYSNQALAGQEFGKETYLRVRADTGQNRRTYIWSPRPVPLGATVVSATLVMVLKDAWSGTTNVTAARITETWKENELNHNNAPAVSGTNTTVTPITSGANLDVEELDVTAMVQDVADGDAWYGIRLISDNTTVREFYSSEAISSKRPSLVVVYNSAPDAPSGLRPDGARVTSLQAPTVAWDSATPESVQVQVDNANDFASVLYDSGTVARTITNFDTGLNRIKLTNQATVETDTTGFQAQSSATIARTTTAGQFFAGVAGLSVTAHASNANSGVGVGSTAADTNRTIVTAGESYTFSAYVKGTDTHTVVMRVGWYDSGNSLLQTDTGTSFAVTTGFVRYSETFTAVANAVTARFQLVFPTGGATQVVYMDNMQVEQSDGVTTWQPPFETGLSDNTTYYWRVRVVADGVTSSWSEPAEFQRRTHGALSITSPANDNDDITDTTPTFTWSFSSRTQTAYSWKLFRNQTLLTSGSKTASTATSFTLARGYIVSTTPDYTLQLRIYDEYQREGLGTDTPYVEAERVFQYIKTSITEAANLTAETEDGHLHLEWTRATAPTFFAIEVDGEVVADLLDPDDLSTGGTGYAYDLYAVAPGQEVTIGVQSVNSTLQHSNNPPEVDATFSPSTVWIVDPEDGTEVSILGRVVETTIGESGATFFVLGRQDPVRVTDSIRGHEGSIKGRLMAHNGLTIANLVDDFDELKSRGSDLRLIYGYENYPVVLGEVSRSLAPTGEQSYEVSVDFWQTDEFTIEWP